MTSESESHPANRNVRETAAEQPRYIIIFSYINRLFLKKL